MLLAVQHARPLVVLARAGVGQADGARDAGRAAAFAAAECNGRVEARTVSRSAPRGERPHLLAIAPLDVDGEV